MGAIERTHFEASDTGAAAGAEVGRTIPAVDRAVRVLNFLAAHPDRRFTVSELARRLQISKASCHSLVVTLARARYLTRRADDKSYSLGPALVHVGLAAGDPHQGLDVAKDEMRSMAFAYGVAAVVSTVVDDEIVILASIGGNSDRPVHQPGQRLPLIPPMGTVFLAWGNGPATERWLARLGPLADEHSRSVFRRALAGVRTRGYAYALENEPLRRLGTVLASDEDPDTPTVREAVRAVAASIAGREDDHRPGEPTAANVLAAPVFDAEGKVALALTVVGPPGNGTNSTLDLVEPLRGAAERVTDSICGRSPDDD